VAQALLRHKNMTTTATFYKKAISHRALVDGMKMLEAGIGGANGSDGTGKRS
jgi:hypothetical protein